MAIEVLGMGRAFTDIIVNVDEAFLAKNGIEKGAGKEIFTVDILRMQKEFDHYTLCAGGSVANSVAGVAAMGGSAAFMGATCDDVNGRFFRNAHAEKGVLCAMDPLESPESSLSLSLSLSACCLVLITPDGERSFAYNKGVADRLNPAALPNQHLTSAKVLLLEGLLVNSPESYPATQAAAKISRAAGNIVAVTLHDLSMPSPEKSNFMRFVESHADIIIGNRKEMTDFLGHSQQDFDLVAFENHQTLIIMTDGEYGIKIAGAGNYLTIPVHPTNHIQDLTGAGDQCAAGFLLAYARGLSLPECGALGVQAAAEIIRTVGGRPQGSWRQLVAANNTKAIGKALIEACQASPLKEIDLEPDSVVMPVRDVHL